VYKSIFVPVDNSEHSNVCETFGIELAKTFSARIAGNHVYAAKLHDMCFKQMEFTLSEEYKEETELEKQRRIHDALITRGLQLISDSYLDRMEILAKEGNIEFERRMSDGRNFEALVEDINENDYDLVLMGALGQGAVKQSNVGSVAERTLRRTLVDTLIVRDIEAASMESAGAIVVAMDGSAWSWGALKSACELARKNDRALEIVAAHNPDVPGEELIEAHLKLARKTARNYGLDVRTMLLDGEPATELLRHLETSKPWLVAMGRHGIDTDTHGPEVGSVTEQVMRSGPTNVFIVSQTWTPTSEQVSKAATA
jgi:nucleotide-binding universal stress UspA family protein